MPTTSLPSASRRFETIAGIAALALLAWAAPVAAGAAENPRVIDLSRNWRVLQDVHDSGEKLGLYRRAWDPSQIGPTISGWQPIPRLAHLQLLLASQPYFGRELRYFNQAPWFYRLEFPTPAQAARATLRFEGVDYYARAWLNDELLGEHEGYAEPFEFEVGHLLARDRPNVLVVKVSSPWDTEVAPDGEKSRFFSVIRRMLKGSYEHADTFVQRDVNPIGIWRPVRLLLHDGLRPAGDPAIVAGNTGEVEITWPVALDEGPGEAELAVVVRAEPTGVEVARASKTILLRGGVNQVETRLTVPSPKLWNTWDRGGPALYQAEIEIRRAGRPALASASRFGFRTVELRRTPGETTFLLNGRPLYLRGATYWPDLYLSAVDRARYERDVAAAVRAGINALRVHVHTENPPFYEICDRLGVAVLQDSDLNWTVPTDEAFVQRAAASFRAMIRQLRNHPGIIAWIALNESSRASRGALGPRLVEEARKLDPSRPVIRNSGEAKELESGDAHDYRGSLNGGRYTDIYGSQEKLATEFGVDAPPGPQSARIVPRIAERLAAVMPRVAELHDYQYRLLKYYMEHYRIQKYAPNSGYVLFMWIDFSPQSFYGVYDYWGQPKVEGLGGGLRALEESNAPVGIFMEYKDAPVALHAVNDTLADLGACTAEWTVTDGAREVAKGEAPVRLRPDSHVRIAGLAFPVNASSAYRVSLLLRGPDGRELARNLYRDPFHHPEHPEGHPKRMDHEMGLRLWWAPEER